MMSLNSGCFLMNAATIGQVATTRLPSARFATAASPTVSPSTAIVYFPSAALTVASAPVLSVVICGPTYPVYPAEGRAAARWSAVQVRARPEGPARWPQDLHGQPHHRPGDPVAAVTATDQAAERGPTWRMGR